MSKPLGLSVDPDLVSCGEATRAVRSLLRLHARTRWFEPGPTDKPVWFARHLALVRPHAPSAFARDVVVSDHVGGWSVLESLAARARARPTSGLDWKFDVLKPIGRDHSRARGWTPALHAQRFQTTEPSDGDLFFLYGETAMWRLPTPTIDLSRAGPAREAAGWYQGFAAADLIEALEWQLAEGTDDMETNPFLPLLLGYAHGQYPFVLDESHVIVFRFGEPSS